MDRNFARAISLVLKWEGGYSNHPQDKGGPTNRGITLATFRRYVDRSGTVDDLKRLTVDQAGKVYRRQYWDKVRGDDLPDGIDYAVFDFAVNSGPARARKYLQRAAGVAQDGVIGPVTLAAVRGMDPVTLIEGLCASRMAFLKRIKSWPVFGEGWTNRVNDVRRHAINMVSAPQPPVSARKPAPTVPIPGKAETRSAGKHGGLAAAFVLLVAAVAGFWNEITTWIGSWF